jgi:hypothetical protein
MIVMVCDYAGQQKTPRLCIVVASSQVLEQEIAISNTHALLILLSSTAKAIHPTPLFPMQMQLVLSDFSFLSHFC